MNLALLDGRFVATLLGLAWRNHVKRAFESGTLNSESALQAALVGALAPLAPDMLVFVEPMVDPKTKGDPDSLNMKPDLCLVCEGRLLAVIELKFDTNNYVDWRGDIRKLVQMLGKSDIRGVGIDPTGSRHGTSWRITNETLGVFAVVGKDDADAVDGAAVGKSDELQAGDAAFRGGLLHAFGFSRSGRAEFDWRWLTKPAQ